MTNEQTLHSDKKFLGRAGRILVVDDEEVICHTLRLYLESEGFSVEAVQSARAALALLEHNAFEVLILDILMPQMNGLELMQKLRERGVATEIIVTTGAGSQDIGVEAMRLGAFEIIRKPILSLEEKLLPAVRQAVDRYRIKQTLRRKEEEAERLSKILNEVYQYERRILNVTSLEGLEAAINEAARMFARVDSRLFVRAQCGGFEAATGDERPVIQADLIPQTPGVLIERIEGVALRSPIIILPVVVKDRTLGCILLGGLGEESLSDALPILLLLPAVGCCLLTRELKLSEADPQAAPVPETAI